MAEIQATYVDDPMMVYLAAPFSWRDEIQAFADELEVLGIKVTS